jgi:hypothetical protein
MMICDPPSADGVQQAHVQRTQNAGQAVSGADSSTPIGQVSGMTSALRPLASDIKRASVAMRSARRTFE